MRSLFLLALTVPVSICVYGVSMLSEICYYIKVPLAGLLVHFKLLALLKL